ncbi:MAG: hypothetical protein LBD37_00235, partial [Treponema sp.]|nr:hypothetical protein [Treponema sp.]
MKKIEKKLKERKPLTGVLLAALALSVLLAACPQPTDDPVDNPPVITDPNNPNNPDDPQNPVNTFVPVTGISGVPTGGVKGSPISLAVASAVPGNATNKTIVWSLKNEGITRMARSVDGNTYTPQQAGQATLTAVIANGLAVGQDFTRDFELVITDNHKPVTGITGVPQSGTLGTVIDLTGVTVEPADASDTGIAWSVAADSQVNGTLGGSGFIPESAGTLKLTATIAQGKSGTEAYTQTFTITIVIIPVTSITGVPLSGTDGEAIDLSGVTVEPANASSKAIVWSAPVGSGTWNTAGTAFTPNSSGNLQLTATVAQGKADGTAYTQTFTIAVASRYPQFYFQNTETDTSGTEFDLNAWTGEGTATQGWSISADEQPAVYFAVGKEAAAQTITVGGTHAALVTQATSGTVDGSAAGPELSVFTVDSSAFDLMFTGGSRAF